MEDWQLLQDYAERGSESAFRTLVGRHLGLVHSAALRQVNERALADEVSQAVFVLLARKARKLSRRAPLAGWLFQTARFVAARTLRSELRRQRREQEAVTMQELSRPDETWRRIAPELDEGLERLGAPERHAILLRFFEEKNHQQVGLALGITEEAAKKRVNRALEKLRAFFARRGLIVSASVLTTALAANGAAVAPAGLEASIVSSALAGAGAAGTALPTLVRTTLEAWRLAKLKLAGVFGGLAIGLGLVIHGALPAAEQSPDPVVLLKKVAQARQRITTGELELELATYGFDDPLDGTNLIRMKGLFDGETHRRFESFERKYFVALDVADASVVINAKRQELKLDRDGAVRAGLLTPVDWRDVMVYDGQSIMGYSAGDGQRGRTVIDSIEQRQAAYIFDPRCLGLWTWLTPDRTIENCLRYADAQSVSLVGQEVVEGVATWHVFVQSNYGEALDYWIDVAKPTHVIRHAYGRRSTATSKFDPEHPEDPIPIEVTILDFNGKTNPVSAERFLRRSARYNMPVDPVSWTLAGLHMPIGTEVADYTSNRVRGYWNGTGLSPELPANAVPSAQRWPLPSPAQILALANQDPKSPFARVAASWILLKNPGSPEVEAAANLIRREHLRSTNLAELCRGLVRSLTSWARDLLESLVATNPHPDVQAHAGLALAAHLTQQANETGDPQAAAKAQQLLEQITTDFSQVHSEGKSLADQAQQELMELRRLGIGQPAPEIEAEDLDGQLMTLSDYRGKVVVLVFWGTWCGPCMALVPEERKMVERLAAQPFALIGVNSDKDLAKLKLAIAKEGITWPSFRDGARGTIAKEWKVRSWPATYVLDRKGVIRYRNVSGHALDQAVNALLLQ